MSLRKLLLQKLASATTPSNRRATLSIPDEGSGWSVGVTTDRRDEIGCVVWEVGLRYKGDVANRGDENVSTWATRIAGAVRGLLETLKVVEVDAPRNQAMLRSDPPSPQGDRVAYYEVILTGTTAATARRYMATANGSERREQIPFTLTNEVLAKFITDLAGTE
jgi:hypothetical protein